MKINYKLIYCSVLLACLGMLFPSCQEVAVQKDKPPAMDSIGVSTSGAMRYEGELISVPSPVQIANLLQKNNIPYKKELVNPIESKSKYLNEAKKAMNLGIYGADLAYIANYNLGQINNDYFDALANISSDLNILGNIDKRVVTKLASNLNNRDSILALNTEFFRLADRYLKNNQRPSIGSYVLIGGWVESLHLAADAGKDNEELRKRLGEQKYSAESIMNLATKLDDPAFSAVKLNLKNLCEALKKLESSYNYRQPINDQREKITYLRSQSSVKIDIDEMKEIADLVEIVRNAIIE